MNPDRLRELLKTKGFSLFVGVPCSILTDFLDRLMHDPEVTYVSATREDEAIGIAVGAYLGGRKCVVFMQNSGLGVTINALNSLVLLYKIPLLFLITWRGETDSDAPEHSLMGKRTTKLLETLEIPTYVLGIEGAEETVSKACSTIDENKRSVAILIREGTLK